MTKEPLYTIDKSANQHMEEILALIYSYEHYL